MKDKERICSKCGEIFVVREIDGTCDRQYCPICMKNYYEEQAQEKKRREDIAWQRKHEQDVLLFEKNLKEWKLLSLPELEEQIGERPLYVIGNGFDMMHGVRSSYYDFGKTLGKRSPVRFCLENYLKADDLWADFEGALGKINIEAMCQPYIIDGALDVMGAYDEDAGAAEIFMAAEMAAGPIISMSTELKDRFRKWIESLHVNTNDRPLERVVKKGKVLDFNYTEFIEDMYGMSENDICYIHGRRKKKGRRRQELILGHIPGANDPAYEFKDNYSGIDNLDDNAQMIYDVQQITVRMVSDADEELTKNCDEIIQNHRAFFESLSDVDQVITIGHSLYPVDWDYFKEVIRCCKNAENIRWYFGCYGNGDLERMWTFVKHFGINKDHVFIFRTDTIHVRILPDDKKIKTDSRKKKTLALSEDGRWKVTCEDIKVDIIDRSVQACCCSRMFGTHINGGVFDKSGTILFLIARGLYEGVFLFRLIDGKWQYVRELEGIPHQGVITKRLKKILLSDGQAVFVYNSRIRKYDVDSGELVYNKASRCEGELEGEDLTGEFRKIYRTGFY